MILFYEYVVCLLCIYVDYNEYVYNKIVKINENIKRVSDMKKCAGTDERTESQWQRKNYMETKYSRIIKILETKLF